jgi:pilus assembly protein CpaB
MRGRIVLLLLLALVIAAGTGYLTLQRLQRPAPAQQAAAAAQPVSQPLLVAVRDLPSGHVVQADDLRVADWPAGALPPGSIKPGDLAFGETVVRLPVAMNTPILATQVLPKGKGSQLAYLLGDQRVAKTIPLSETGGLAGHLMPGDKVDVLLTHEVAPPDGAGSAVPQQVTETLLLGLKVLATDQRIDDVNGQISVSSTATLEVSSKEAEMLALAQQVGQLSLALNSAVEPASFDLRRAFEVRRSHIASYTLPAELTFASAPAAAPAPAAGEPPPPQQKAHVVIVVRGSAQQEMVFEGGQAQPLQSPQQSSDPEAASHGANVAVKYDGAD